MLYIDTSVSICIVKHENSPTSADLADALALLLGGLLGLALGLHHRPLLVLHHHVHHHCTGCDALGFRPQTGFVRKGDTHAFLGKLRRTELSCLLVVMGHDGP